jgi:hypothetical protein
MACCCGLLNDKGLKYLQKIIVAKLKKKSVATPKKESGDGTKNLILENYCSSNTSFFFTLVFIT